MQVQVRLLLPTDIQYFWDKIRPLIQQTGLPNVEVTEDHVTHVLARLVSGTAQCWVSGTNNTVHGAVLTTAERDTLTGMKYLHICAFFGFETLDLQVLNDLNKKLEGYAKLHGCSAIIARVPDERVQNIVMRYGASPIPMFYKEV